jgi:hypothetical protein
MSPRRISSGARSRASMRSRWCRARSARGGATALDSVGGYPHDTLAEDQDLTIAIQRKGWLVEYDVDAVAWTEAPESFGALAKQRFRWAFGTLQCLWKHRRILRERQAGGPRAGRHSAGVAVPDRLCGDLAADRFRAGHQHRRDGTARAAAWLGTDAERCAADGVYWIASPRSTRSAAGSPTARAAREALPALPAARAALRLSPDHVFGRGPRGRGGGARAVGRLGQTGAIGPGRNAEWSRRRTATRTADTLSRPTHRCACAVR